MFALLFCTDPCCLRAGNAVGLVQQRLLEELLIQAGCCSTRSLLARFLINPACCLCFTTHLRLLGICLHDPLVLISLAVNTHRKREKSLGEPRKLYPKMHERQLGRTPSIMFLLRQNHSEREGIAINLNFKKNRVPKSW